ncbi:flagellar basal body L-ring protein FlgH [Bremerella alba]|uniref:Flagellar L-ring protein n=1 Tax=Bremerella alba TaxID=980252 RepID=A0A7V8V8W7_9BACT|nr:flagellar basal body L-ring protein FlgH [Bremerella alba]MBA2117088.1 Flagellar L-ring protein [Bremerella alba]
MKLPIACLVLLQLAVMSDVLVAQQGGPVSSLGRRNMPEGQIAQGMPYNGTTKDLSWMHRELPPPREVQIHDLIHIRVDERAQAFSDGEIDRKKTGQYAAILTDWIRLDGINSIKPAVQAEGDPRITGTLNQRLKSEAEMETSEGLKFTIAAEVQEILPNGTLKLEARKTITVNDEIWVYHLRGVCRTEDINPNNTVLSEHLADLTITKEDHGSVRDAYRRGWLLTLWDKVHWF